MPNLTFFQDFTQNLPQLSQAQRDSLTLPFQNLELAAAIEASANGKLPGLDGLPYEFYKATFHLIGDHLPYKLPWTAAAYRPPCYRELSASYQVLGVPATLQFRPITLRCADYKLLTKILCQRLLPLLPSVLLTAQLCPVQGL